MDYQSFIWVVKTYFCRYKIFRSHSRVIPGNADKELDIWKCKFLKTYLYIFHSACFVCDSLVQPGYFTGKGCAWKASLNLRTEHDMT